MADNLAQLADILRFGKGDSIQAEQLARQALAINEMVYTHPNKALINALSALSGALFAQRRFGSGAFVSARIAMKTELLGSDNAAVANTLFNLGDIAIRRRHFVEGERLLRQSLELTRRQRHTIG